MSDSTKRRDRKQARRARARLGPSLVITAGALGVAGCSEAIGAPPEPAAVVARAPAAATKPDINRAELKTRLNPLDGEGLRQYPVSVEDGRIFVDVNEITTSTTAG